MVLTFIPFEDIQQRKFQRNLNADKVVLVDSNGNIIDENHPLPTTSTTEISGLTIDHVKIQETPPIDATKLNSSDQYVYDINHNIIQIIKTIDFIRYQKTYAYTGTDLISSSTWEII